MLITASVAVSKHILHSYFGCSSLDEPVVEGGSEVAMTGYCTVSTRNDNGTCKSHDIWDITLLIKFRGTAGIH